MNEGNGIIWWMELQVSGVQISVFPWTENVFFFLLKNWIVLLLLNLGKENNFWSCKDFSSFSPLEPGLSLAGRIHSVVGRLICLSAFVSGDGLVRTQGCSYHSNRVSEFSPGVSPVTTHRDAPFSVSHFFFWNCDNRNTCFCLFELSSTFQNVTYLVTCLSHYWLHIKYIKLRYIRNNIPFIVGFCII